LFFNGLPLAGGDRAGQRSLAIGPFVATGGHSALEQRKLLIMMILCAANRARLGDRMSAGPRGRNRVYHRT